jgi:rhodanese-related sulfurtransferase
MACLVADAIWFYLGRYRGNQVLGLLCRISLEPDSCVRRTQNVFTKYGLPGVVVAKFIPGMSTVAPPVAGMSKIGAGRFLFVDGIGSALYGVCLLGSGNLFNRQIDQILGALGRIGGSAFTLLITVVVLFIIYKFWQRQRLLNELRMARITASEVREMLKAGQTPVIFDLRSNAAVEEDPVVIQGAIHVGIEEIESRLSELPKDRDIIVYCSCPNEVSSARLALRLKRKGFTRVRPLLGGIDAWREQKYPLEARNKQAGLLNTGVAGNSEPGVLAITANVHLESVAINPLPDTNGENK